MIDDHAKTIELLAVPLDSDPTRHSMTMRIDGGLCLSGINVTSQTPKEIFEEFKLRHPRTTVTLIDRTVQ